MKKAYVIREVKYFKSRIPATQANNKESTNPLLNPLTGKETTPVAMNSFYKSTKSTAVTKYVSRRIKNNYKNIFLIET
ncbi:hypothetical protein T4C_1347 [Trichinella pseudospiralis]|uniref:Uncharacterized protein n=1 Tax=Trichinella pseudospiralis TaxID=6337 RepID=A0A0V1JLB9_TRIPS|nr:hypothetical protein T4C_1347 [Trichinella pseudospiralis]